MKYQDRIEAKFLALRFQNGVLKHKQYRGSTRIRYVLLTEDQALYVATLSRNTDQVTEFKAKIAYLSAGKGNENQKRRFVLFCTTLATL